jgi:hypothetical protein
MNRLGLIRLISGFAGNQYIVSVISDDYLPTKKEIEKTQNGSKIMASLSGR